jgi:ubiquinone biosynthesis protein UbiJ
LINPISAKLLETLLNQALHLDPFSLEALGKLSGKIIRFELSGIELNLTLFPDEQGIVVFSDYEGEVDVCIAGAPFTLLRLLRQRDVILSDELEITIKGEVSIAQNLLLILQGLNIDWEGLLAKRLGNVPAHKLSAVFHWGQNSVDKQFHTFQHKLSKSLQEKTGYLPSRAEIGIFSRAVDTLHDDLERLEQRVQVLAMDK